MVDRFCAREMTIVAKWVTNNIAKVSSLV